MWVYLERVNINNVNIYILYPCDFHAQNNIVFIFYISNCIILTFILSLLFIFNYNFFFDLSNNIHYYLLNGKFPNMYNRKKYFEIDVYIYICD